MPNADYLIWIDLEMTGLDPSRDHIIEIATLVSDSKLNLVAEGPVIAVHQPDDVLAQMDAWNVKTHGESGLTQRVKQSRLDAAEAERQTLEFLRHLVPEGVSPMCGNSICQDRRFLARHMPALERFFHYRNLDVSTLKELAVRWYPQMPKFPKKQSHQALDDIRESLEELRFYRERLFKGADG